jgi:hypothetical protein
VVLSTDQRAILDGFDQMYGRFRSPDHEASGSPDGLRLTILFGGRGGHGPLLISPAGRQRVSRADLSPSLYFHVLSHVYARCAGPVFHAAVAARDGRGLMVCAASGGGKTTLILDLIRRGWEFLSDELAPIGPGGQVEPFPRALGLRAGTLALHPWLGDAAPTVDRNGTAEFKALRDPGALPGVRLGQAVPLRCVVFVDPPLEPDPPEGSRTLELGFPALSAPLLERLAKLPGVLAVSPLEGRYYPTLRVTVAEGADVAESIERLAGSLGLPIVSTRWGRSAPPDYAARPVLTRLRASDGVIDWQRHLLNARPSSRLLVAHGGSGGRLLLTLGELSRGVRFHRLTVGRLHQMTELLETAVADA